MRRVIASMFVIFGLGHLIAAALFVRAADSAATYVVFGAAALLLLAAGGGLIVAAGGVMAQSGWWRSLVFLASVVSAIVSILALPPMFVFLLLDLAIIVGVLRFWLRQRPRQARLVARQRVTSRG